jgi:hypothetical protein
VRLANGQYLQSASVGINYRIEIWGPTNTARLCVLKHWHKITELPNLQGIYLQTFKKGDRMFELGRCDLDVLVTLQMKALPSSETLVEARATRRKITQDGILQDLRFLRWHYEECRLLFCDAVWL